VYLVPANVDVGVMVELFGDHRNGVHECHRPDKILELPSFAYFISLQGPAIELLELDGNPVLL
jgi:hypothetical protein